MVLLKYLLMVTGTGLLIAAAAILAWDLYKILSRSKSLGEPAATGPGGPLAAPRWALARQLALPGFGLWLAGLQTIPRSADLAMT